MTEEGLIRAFLIYKVGWGVFYAVQRAKGKRKTHYMQILVHMPFSRRVKGQKKRNQECMKKGDVMFFTSVQT